MEPATYVITAALVALVSGVLGKAIGTKGKVSNGTCAERRESCSSLLVEKIENVTKVVERIEKKVDGYNNKE